MKNIKSKAFICTAFIVSIIGLLLTAPSIAVDGKPADESQAVAAKTESPSETAAAVSAPQEAAPAAAEEKNAEAQEGESASAPEEAAPVQPGNVTVNFKGADIRTVLAYLSEVSGVDIVPAPDVKGVVDLKLTNKPWKVALDIIVRNYGFAYDREGDIIRVITLDKLKQEDVTTQAFYLNYAKAKDVHASVKDIVGDRGKVMYDERTNTIIVTEIPTKIYQVGKVIERLDKRTPQVLIEARVIETVLDDTEKLGIDWNVKVSISGAKRPTTLPFENFRIIPGQATKFFPQVQTTSNSSVAQTSGGATTTTATTESDFPSDDSNPATFPFAAKDQFTFGTLDFSQFTAVLEMIKSRANTDIVSNPRIATLNNMEAVINVGQTLNMPKYERNSTTGKMEITGYDPKLLGIILKVTPHINDVGDIVIDLNPQISDLLRYDTLDRASGVVAPVFSQREAKTQIMVKDGDTIFIGGLIKENDVKGKKKLPIAGDLFGDIPYFGLLFQKNETTKQKVELIFFMTVYVMQPGQEVKDAPSAAKVYAPAYTLTQEEVKSRKKKSLKR